MRQSRTVISLLSGFLSALLFSGVSLFDAAAQAQVLIRITAPPPPLPVYVQPVIPAPDFIWVPGYWAWGEFGYFWVPGTWVRAPAPGLLWTPGYWAWNDGIYVWRAGYWGPRVGFYGGVNYGFGYTGVGYYGGYWRDRVFVYNTAVNRVGSVQITNVYNKTVVNTTTVNNISFNGGPSGLKAVPNAQELAAAQDKHLPPTALQSQHHDGAGKNRALFASVNNGRPGIAATTKAGEFSGPGTVAAHAAMAGHGQGKMPAGPGLRREGRLESTKMAGAPMPKHVPRQPKHPPHQDKRMSP
jgi:hypothetical protein